VNPRRKNSVLIPALIVALLGGYAIGRHPTVIDIAVAAERTPLYYQDPSGKPDYSPTPKKDAEGRDYVPVYDEPGATTSMPASPAPSPSCARSRTGICAIS
jgi:Cu(I)/Ag(I) efflux system membrane fusion protein